MEELKQYLIGNKVSRERIQAETADLDQRPLPRRDLFQSLQLFADGFLDHHEQPRLIALAGLRGVGKTTLIWQTAEYIFQEKSTEIYFIGVDDLKRLGFRLYDAFNILEKDILKKPFHELNHPIVFLIDEVHEAEGWDTDLKILYEKCKRAFILCTGSSALLLHQSPDLASRWSLLRLFPFRFSEFINSKAWLENRFINDSPSHDLGISLKQILFYSKDIVEVNDGIGMNSQAIRVYLKTLSSTFPDNGIESLIHEYIAFHNIARFLNIKNENLINDRIIDLIERILLKDIPAFMKTAPGDSEIMFRLLLRLALSEEINIEKLSNQIGCRQNQVVSFIETLHKAEILNVLTPFGGTSLKTGQLRKPFFMSPSLRLALFKRVYGETGTHRILSKLLEDIVAMYLSRVLQQSGLLSFGYSGDGVSPDFIVETLDHPIVIETGLKKTSVRQTEKYRQHQRYGIIINTSDDDFRIKDNNIFIPLSWFLLL